MLDLFVLDAISDEKISACIQMATEQDFAATQNWQTSWNSTYAQTLPNKVALHWMREDLQSK